MNALTSTAVPSARQALAAVAAFAVAAMLVALYLQHVVGLKPVKIRRAFWRYRRHIVDRLHNESVRNIDEIRRIVRGRTRETSVLPRMVPTV